MGRFPQPSSGSRVVNAMSSDPLVSRTTKHTGSIKSLQFNPFKSELLATAGAKGEVRTDHL